MGSVIDGTSWHAGWGAPDSGMSQIPFEGIAKLVSCHRLDALLALEVNEILVALTQLEFCPYFHFVGRHPSFSRSACILVHDH